jgi:hypothetical protein
VNEQQYQQLQNQLAINGVKGLFWSQDAYSYITKQSDLFDAMLAELIEQYTGSDLTIVSYEAISSTLCISNSSSSATS